MDSDTQRLLFKLGVFQLRSYFHKANQKPMDEQTPPMQARAEYLRFINSLVSYSETRCAPEDAEATKALHEAYATPL